MPTISGFPRILTVGVIGLFFVVIFLGLALSHTLDRNLNPTRDEQCEPLATATDPSALILERQNTWSNFAYLLVGIVIMYRSRNLLGAIVGLNLSFEFLFSGLYHGKLTDSMQFMDVAWIYVLLLTLIACAVQCVFVPLHDPARETEIPAFTIERIDSNGSLTRGVNWSLIVALVVGAASIGIGIVIRVIRPDSTNTTIFLVCVLVLILVWRYLWFALVWLVSRVIQAIFPPKSEDLPTMSGVDVLDIILILVFGFVAMLFRFSDGPKAAWFDWCTKDDSKIQPHAVWHVTSAILALAAYDFFCHFFPEQGRVFANWLED